MRQTLLHPLHHTLRLCSGQLHTRVVGFSPNLTQLARQLIHLLIELLLIITVVEFDN